MQTTTTAANLAHWIQAAPEASDRLRLVTRDDGAHVLIDLGIKEILQTPEGATTAGNQLVKAAEGWAAGGPGDHHFIVQVVDDSERPLQSSQFRITGDAATEPTWATGSPESVVASLQTGMASQTKIYQDGWKALQRGFMDLMTLQQNRIVALEGEAVTHKARVADLESDSGDVMEELAQTERLEKIMGGVKEIVKQYNDGKLDIAALKEAAVQEAKGTAGAKIADAVVEVVTGNAPAAPE